MNFFDALADHVVDRLLFEEQPFLREGLRHPEVLRQNPNTKILAGFPVLYFSVYSFIYSFVYGSFPQVGVKIFKKDETSTKM